MLGANVGTTLIVQILSFNIAAVAPFCSSRAGRLPQRRAFASRSAASRSVYGLMLLALHILPQRDLSCECAQCGSS